jgi:hypothetical protein
MMDDGSGSVTISEEGLRIADSAGRGAQSRRRILLCCRSRIIHTRGGERERGDGRNKGPGQSQ